MKNKYYIDLNNCTRVKEFVSVAQAKICDVTLKSGRYNVDGKSIMGIFSLDLSQPVELIVADNDYSSFTLFMIK